jgi:hypothetical protein
LNGWNTWQNWVQATTVSAGPTAGDGDTGYLRRIGAPIIRIDEETADAARVQAPCAVYLNAFNQEISVPPLINCAFPSDARAHTWPYADYWGNARFLLSMAHMIQRRYGVSLVDIVAHSKGTEDTDLAVADEPQSFNGVVLEAPMYHGTDLANNITVLLLALLLNSTTRHWAPAPYLWCSTSQAAPSPVTA